MNDIERKPTELFTNCSWCGEEIKLNRSNISVSSYTHVGASESYVSDSILFRFTCIRCKQRYEFYL